MASLCLSSSRIVSLHHQKPFLSLKLRPRPSDLSGLGRCTSAVSFNPLRLSGDRQRTSTVSVKVEKRRKRGSSVVCYAAPISVDSLQWISTISCLALMLARGTAIHKSVVVPLFALHAPSSIITWIKGEYGVWAAFLALIARLFFTFPGELELPFIALLLVIVAPYQVMNIRGKQEGAIISIAISCFLAFQHFSRAGSLEKAYEKGELELPFIALLLVIVAPYQVMSIRGKQEGAILSLAISCFLAFQHFSRAGSLQRAFDQSSVLATVAIIGVTVVSLLLLL